MSSGLFEGAGATSLALVSGRGPGWLTDGGGRGLATAAGGRADGADGIAGTMLGVATIGGSGSSAGVLGVSTPDAGGRVATSAEDVVGEGMPLGDRR